MKYAQGYISLETVQILLEGALEQLANTDNLTQRLLLYGKIDAYSDLINTHVKAWKKIKGRGF